MCFRNVLNRVSRIRSIDELNPDAGIMQNPPTSKERQQVENSSLPTQLSPKTETSLYEGLLDDWTTISGWGNWIAMILPKGAQFESSLLKDGTL